MIVKFKFREINIDWMISINDTVPDYGEAWK